MIYAKIAIWALIEWVAQSAVRCESEVSQSCLFPQIIELVLENEGDWAPHPPDHGGLTRYGISSVSHPHIKLSELTPQKASQFYHTRYWLPYAYHRLKCPHLTYKLFDMSVLLGPQRVHEIFRKAVQAQGICLGSPSSDQREIMAAANFVDPHKLLASFKMLLRARFKAIACKNPSKEIYLKGWLQRVNHQPRW